MAFSYWPFPIGCSSFAIPYWFAAEGPRGGGPPAEGPVGGGPPPRGPVGEGARRGAWGGRGGSPKRLHKAPTDKTKPQQTIQSPDRQYKAPEY